MIDIIMKAFINALQDSFVQRTIREIVEREVLPALKDHVTDEKAEAYEEGYDEGYEVGFDKGCKNMG
jgi:flagellar biosynthesis/type III secretory pathway protein FliH